MAGRKIEFAIPLQSNVSLDEPSSLPSSPTAADADITMELPYATPNYSLAIQSKRALSVRNALVASKLSSCSVETLLRTIEANASGGAAVEKDEFIEMVRILPELRSGEAFRPIEDTLERIYRSFEAANRVDLYLLGIGCLPLIQGTVREKLHGAIKLSLFGCGVPMDDPISLSVLKTALACLVLSITAVFDLDSATPAQLQSTSTIVTTSVSEAVARLFASYALARDATVAFDAHVWPWVDANAAKACPWLKLVDQQKWPTTKRLTSPTKSDGASASSPRRWASHSSATSSQADGSASALDSVGESQATTAGTSASLDPPALSFRFSSVDGGVLSIGDEQASKLFDLLTQAAFTKVHPKAMYDTFVQHTGDGLLEEETFLEAIEELLSMTNVPHLSKDSEFLDGMIDIFRCFLPENVLRVDAFEIAAGFSLFTWGSKSDKLSSAFHYFDADSKGFLNQQQLWRFLRSIVTILLYLSPPNAMVLHRHGSIAALVDTGEDEIMDSIAEGLSDEYGAYDDDDSDNSERASDDGAAHERELANSELRAGVFTFEDFGLWYNDGGYKDMSWLELLDLRKWMFVSPAFAVDRLDVQPVDPVYASSNYYTANNIQVDVDGDNIDDLKDGQNQFAFAEKIVEEDDDDDDDDDGGNGGDRAHPASLNSALLDPPGNSQSSFGSTASDARSHASSIPSTLPVFCLKNEVVLEFDLTFDADDDALPELPLTTLSFNNGDLLMYAELQRVTKLQQVDLNRVYEVFAPLMDRPSGASIEKSTFDECVRRLLPRDVAGDVVAAFGVHTNTRVPPPSVGRGNDSKMAADTLSRLFFAFNRGGTGRIDLVEFLSAFSMFCAGTKSQKLGYAYGLFDVDHDGSLTRREMWKYLRSFLTMLLALGNGSELSAEAIASVADTTAIQIADTIFRDAGKTFSVRQPSPRRRHESHHRRSLESLEAAGLMTTNRSRRHENGRHRYEHRGSLPDDDSIRLTGAAQSAAGAGAGNAFIRGGVVSFQEFATWYSTRGHIIIAWIELLDTKKWPEVTPSVADAILRYISRQQRVIVPGGRGGDNGDGARDSGSSSDTESSTESNHFRDRRSSLDQRHGAYPDTNMTIISAADLRTGTATTALERMDGIGGIADLITSPPTSSSTAPIKDLSSVALQFKLMNFDSTTLRIRLKDVAIVYTISERMTLSHMKCRDLVNLLDKYAQGRTLTKQGYLRAMRELVPRDVLSNEDQEFLSFHLLRIYTLFETEGAGDATTDDASHGASSFIDDVDSGTSAVDKLLVLSGLSIFCGTTKSAKLGTLFKVFDTHSRGCVSRRHLFELLKSILVVLFAFSSYNANRAHTNDTATTNALSTNSVAERAAGAVVSKIFCEATCSSRDGITLAEFAAWYAAGGYMDCPWLELLDLSKWPAKEAFEASKSEKHLICAFDLQDDANILNFTETDVSTYLFVLRSTNLFETSVSKIYDSLLAFATPPPDEAKKKKTAGLGKGQGYSYAGVEEDEGAYLVISRSNFYECIRSLVSKDNMTEKAQQTSSKLLSRIFNVFDRKRCGRVNALELACGMSILGKGSKSQKLALAFDFIARMRQQRTRTLNVYASVNAGAFGLNGGVNSAATGGGPTFGLPSTRGGGLGAHAAAMRRTAMQHEHANGLPHSVLFIYLRSFLLALMALSDGTYRLGIEKMFTEAEDMIEEAMGDLMTDVSATGSTAPSTHGFAAYGSVRSRACVTFEQFGEWYNTGGCQIISWVELLDVSKWQQEHDYQEQTASLAGVGTGRVMSRRVAMLGSQRHGHYPVSTSTTPILEPVQPIENYYSTKPFTQRKQVRQSEIVSTSYATGLAPARAAPANSGATKHARDSIGALSLCSDGPLMVFSVARQAAEIHFFHEDLTRLRQLLHQTQLPHLAPDAFGAALHAALCIERTGATAALVTRSHLIQSIEAVVCAPRTRDALLPPPPASLSDDSMELLDQVLSVFVREPDAVKSGESSAHDGAQDAAGDDDDELNDGNDVLEFGAAVCGLLVVCDGTLAAKLSYAAHLLEDGVAADDAAPVVVMETLKSALTCFLMAFYGLSSSLSAEVVRFSADLGAEDVLRSFLAAMTRSRSRSSSSSGDDEAEETKRSDAATHALDLTASVALREFSDWFSDAGYHAHPWLELTELQNWPAAMHMGDADAS